MDKIVKHILIILFISLFPTTVVAKVEIWECYYPSGNVQGVYKLDTSVPSVAIRKDGRWSYYDDIVYEEENQNLNDGDVKTWDLLLKKFIKLMDSDKDCKVIGP